MLSTCSEFILYGLINDTLQGIVGKRECDAIHLKEFLILADYGVFGFYEYSSQGISIERVKVSEHWQSTDYFGYEAKRFQVLRQDISHHVLFVNIPYILH